MNTSTSIFCESIAFFVFKAREDLLVFSELPRVLHHQREVVVAVDGAAHSFVVFEELLEGHDTVGLLRVPLRHELIEDLIRGLLSLLNFRMFGRVV